MLFGYMIVRTLLPLVTIFGRLPSGAGRGYARLLNAATPADALPRVVTRSRGWS
jgi:hypothetical protein